MVSRSRSFFTLAFTTFFVLLSFTCIVHAAPWSIHARHSTHRVRHVLRGRSTLQLRSFHPKTTYKTYGSQGKPHKPVRRDGTPVSLQDSALSFVKSELGLDDKHLGYRSGYTTSSGKFAYLNQYHEGIPFSNAVANVVWKENKIVAFGSSFIQINKIASSKPSLNVSDLIPHLEETLGGVYNNHPPSLEYLVLEDNSAALTHVVQIRNDTTGAWWEAFVCAHKGDILSVTDFVSHATYTVVPINKSSFAEGQEKVVDPEDLEVSPFGWHNDSTGLTSSTIGNNVASFIGQEAANETSPVLNFDAPYNDKVDPEECSNADAARINAFFIANTFHDFAYRYGFTEKAFNFQASNFDKGGQGGDPVLVSVHDRFGVNNANFATPPDGQPGVCRMFIWTLTNPPRDGAMENTILVHELTHGVTSRLTGGGTARCLQTLEAGGLGEGWSDAMAEWMTQTSAQVNDFAIGTYVANRSGGIRSHPYSTDPNVNPLRYSTLATVGEVHSIGEVWANMLHNVYAALVAKHGFSPSARTNPDTSEGNVVFMRLFMDSLALQPCNPTFVSARDAWIQADENRYNGQNKCLLFTVFARLGLGLNAGPDFVDNGELPLGC